MPKKLKFDFKAALVEMLVRIGAQPSDFYDLVLETRAGPLRLAAYDDWLAARFDSPDRAGEVVSAGSLNRFSGKWNWHFTKPTADDVANLERVILKTV